MVKLMNTDTETDNAWVQAQAESEAAKAIKIERETHKLENACAAKWARPSVTST